MSQLGPTILFGLRGVRVREVVRHSDHGRVVHVLTDDAGAAACPVCGVLSTTVRQRRMTRPRDLPRGEERLVVRWHKVQFSCREMRCPRKAFTEQIAELPAGARVTGRLIVMSPVGSRTAWRSASPATGWSAGPSATPPGSCTPTPHWPSLTR